jgi:Flp pilus assembly protein TadD
MSVGIVSLLGPVARRPSLAVLALTILLGSCTDATDHVQGPLAPAERPVAAAQRSPPAQVDVAPLAAVHKANPADATAALAYARALRDAGSTPQAAAVLDRASTLRPADRRLLLERGLLALDLGEPAKAETLLRQAHDAKAPNWRLHSALGAALASRGKQQEAQVQFAKALALAPDHPSILNNLALSYVLDGKAEEAEKLLRKAHRAASKSAPELGKVQQNLALVLGLRGKFEESRTMAAAALPSLKAQANAAYLQDLAAKRSTTTQTERKLDTAAPVASPKASASLPQPTYQLGGPSPAGK